MERINEINDKKLLPVIRNIKEHAMLFVPLQILKLSYSYYGGVIRRREYNCK